MALLQRCKIYSVIIKGHGLSLLYIGFLFVSDNLSPCNVLYILSYRFGNVLKGEIETCQQIAQQTGILVDPIYTLAAWELSTLLSQEEAGGAKVVMLHTGGTLGMFGIAQRYKSFFQISENV